MNDLSQEIARLKAEKGAVILAHNYQVPEVQDVADITGDSLELAKAAVNVDADTIVFCGVDFMAETAKILNPEKVVIHPDPDSHCPMACMIDIDELKRLKDDNPGVPVVAYVNTTAETKVHVDVCCTSANAVDVVRNIEGEKVIFIPDENLGQFIQQMVPEKELILWPGYCHTHRDITADEVKELKKENPTAFIMVHPECRPEVVDLANFVFSTSGMLRQVEEHPEFTYIMVTEEGLAYKIYKETNVKVIHTGALCPNMKKITLEKVRDSLLNMGPEVDLSDEVLERARAPIERMLDYVG